MGVMYSAFSITEEMASWLKEEAVDFPTGEASRNPSLAEIKSVLAELNEYSIKCSNEVFGSNWQAFIEHKDDPENKGWAILSILKLQEDENEFYFEKGWPELVIEITTKLAEKTGPLVLICDAGGAPLVVKSGANAGELLATWE